MPNKNLLRLDVDYSCQPVFWDQWNPKRRNSASDGMNQGAIETQLEPKVGATKSCEGGQAYQLDKPSLTTSCPRAANVTISYQQIARIIPLNKNDISHFHL